jgi:phosphoribosylglycinamide formyltransferase 1
MRRHAFVANTVAERLDVAGVWCERKSFEPLAAARSDADAGVIERHFQARDGSEAAWFAEHEAPRAPYRQVPPNGCNDPGEIEAMKRLAPDVVLVFGTGLLRPPLIDSFPGRIVNLHLGLSPYYRGAGTNFWPLVNREPEYCGATIHFLDAGVDSGPMIAHVRPDIRRGDGPHDVGNKVIAAAAPVLAEAGVAVARGGVQAVPQKGDGRVYRRSDFSAEAVRALYANFENGMIDEYLAAHVERDAALSLVTLEARR